VAERKGFEPLEPVKVQRFSRPPLSTAQPPLRKFQYPVSGSQTPVWLLAIGY
jgi:hypothetical protein